MCKSKHHVQEEGGGIMLSWMWCHQLGPRWGWKKDISKIWKQARPAGFRQSLNRSSWRVKELVVHRLLTVCTGRTQLEELPGPRLFFLSLAQSPTRAVDTLGCDQTNSVLLGWSEGVGKELFSPSHSHHRHNSGERDYVPTAFSYVSMSLSLTMLFI